MKWYREVLVVVSQPENTIVELIGEYARQSEQTTKPPVSIVLSIQSDDSEPIIYCLYTHSPRGLSYEEPSADDVLNKYRNKIRLCRDKVLAKSFCELSDFDVA